MFFFVVDLAVAVEVAFAVLAAGAQQGAVERSATQLTFESEGRRIVMAHRGDRAPDIHAGGRQHGCHGGNLDLPGVASVDAKRRRAALAIARNPHPGHAGAGRQGAVGTGRVERTWVWW